MHIPIRLLAPALTLLLGVSPLALATEASDRAAIEAAAQAWIKAFNARDADAMVALTTEDVVLLDPNVPPISGRKAARAAWLRALGAAQGQVTTASKEIAIAGDVAWRIGAFAHKLPHDDSANRGQSLEVWQRMNGQWKMHRQMSSTLLAQPKLLTRPNPAEPILDTPRN